MNITSENYGHSVIFNLKGDLTEDSLEPLKQAMDRSLGGKEEVIDVVLNMEQVPFVDSAALEFLLALHERLAERLGQVKLVKCDENVRKILEITRLESTFEIFKDSAEAVKAM